MQSLRRTPDGSGWLCQADECEQRGTLSWSIKADDQGNTTSRYGCDEHQLDPETAGMVHQAGCAAPPVCDCEPEHHSEPTPEGIS